MWKPKGKQATRLMTAAVCASVAVALAAAAPLWTGGASGGGPLAAAGTAASPRDGKKQVFVDGAQTPEQIPDHVAYALIFRAVAGRHSEAQKKSIRSYVAQLGLGREACESCPRRKEPVNPDEPDPEIEALVAAAEEYHRQVGLLDREAKAIKDATWQNPTPAAYAALANLQTRKEELVTSVVAGLVRRLGPDASARLRQNVDGRVKPLTKIRKKAADR